MSDTPAVNTSAPSSPNPASPPTSPSAPNSLPSEAHAIALAEKAMADKINASVQLPTTPTSDAPPAAADPEKPKTPTEEAASRRLAFLARKEQEILRQRRGAQESFRQMQELKQQIEQERAQYQSFFRSLQENPIQALASLGLTYDKLTDAQLSGKPVDTTAMQLQQMKLEQEKFRQQMEERERLRTKQELEATQAQAEQVLERFKEDINSYVDQNKETYELINLNQSQDTVYETVQAYFEKTGKTLTIKEASDMVEDFLVKEAKKIAAAKKLSPPKPQTSTQPSKNPQQFQTKTITNDMAPAGVAPTMNAADGLVSEGEAIRRALSKLNRTG